MLLKIYKTMMQVSTPLLEAYLQRRAERGKEDPARAGERRGQPGRAKGPNPLVWFHAASVGESLSLLALIARVLKDYPECSVMVTTGTVTSAKLMAERLPERAFHQYMPVDHPVWVARFLDHWRPAFVVWSESEFWPNMLTEIAKRKIPAVLLNGRMSEPSFKRWQWVLASARRILSAFALCFAQNDAEAHRLTALGAENVCVSSNLKYGAPLLPVREADLAAAKAAAGSRKLLLFASTHPGEEEIAAEAHLALQKRFPDLLTIVVPRHPARGAEVADLIKKKGLRAARRAAGALPEEQTEVYVADTMGELGLFYRLCNVVVVGGSFADIGGHNPIEPGQLGCIIIYGPVMYNFITISDDFLAANAAIQVKDANALQEALGLALEHPASFASHADAARKMTAAKSRVLDDLMSTLKPLLDAALAGRATAP
ncbi:MAG: 3-deoxy-D-manno-octulosonic acid transferase [Alphaproteobacteria bacterium]|nr:MAG: 3-deoxy-D-manno-octulosonic acid transferase [Alphaproteobacteria bacterium]